MMTATLKTQSLQKGPFVDNVRYPYTTGAPTNAFNKSNSHVDEKKGTTK